MTFRTAVFDIETSDLEAIGKGFIICAVVKPLGKDPRIFRYDRSGDKPGKEKTLLLQLVSELSKYDLVIEHNIKNFDWLFIKSRAMVLDVPFNLRPFYYDTYPAFKRSGFLTQRNRRGQPKASLEFAIDALGLQQEKTHLLPRRQMRTVWEHRAERATAMHELVAHCIADVRMTEKLFQRLYPTDWNAKLIRFA